MYSLVVCSIFKNESCILEEWLTHYINRGVEHFYLVNDGSTDSYEPIIEKYKDYITLFQNEVVCENTNRQYTIYNQYFTNILPETKWLMLIDLDEFIYSPTTVDIPTLLEQYNEYSKIILHWVIFGSNGHITQPKNVIDSFTKRADYSFIPQGKNIVQAKHVTKWGIHDIECTGNYIFLNSESGILLLNHYVIQSKNWFMEVKGTRGDVNRYCDNYPVKRNLDYFNIMDKNDIEDTRLKDQNNNSFKV